MEKFQIHISDISLIVFHTVKNVRSSGKNIIIIIITMARKPYMGLGLLFPMLRGLFCAFAAVRDRLTGRAFQLDRDVTARAIWQSVRRLG
jgi:hypothetical protein